MMLRHFTRLVEAIADGIAAIERESAGEPSPTGCVAPAPVRLPADVLTPGRIYVGHIQARREAARG